eukprot:TRINITY_DN9504_c0_g1_i5.p1 TRINITY_DN9504_c0_g1~~TRINITY_DN9504_c0_g1_i5.p1  ORF type:complete len:807 (+),score=178.45 TRINITY_DN9504_c0_g1_i5:59-2479(+)
MANEKEQDPPLSFSIPQDEWFSYQLKRREQEFTEKLQLKLLLATYNVAGSSPSEVDVAALKRIFTWEDQHADLVVVGLQEVVPLDVSSAASIIVESDRYDAWRIKTRQALGVDEYVEIISKPLFGVFIMAFVHLAHAPHCTAARAETVGVGLLGIGGNKGGAAVRFQLYNSSICVVNSHLAAHQDEVEMRNSDFAEIMRGIRFNIADDGAAAVPAHPDQPQDAAAAPSLRRFANINEHDFVFWIGDLNYRVDLPLADALVSIESGDYDYLMRYDQLRVQREAGHVFQDFLEQPIRFPPTYKYKIGEGGFGYDTSKGLKSKVPAWCDRVLYLPSPDSLQPLGYQSVPSLCYSDHKPVRALFELGARFAVDERLEGITTELTRQIDAWQAQLLVRLHLVPACAALQPQPEDFTATDPGTLQTIRSGFSSVVGAAGKFANTLGSGVSMLSVDKNYITERTLAERKDKEKSIFSGVRKFGEGLFHGVSGVFIKPVEGAQKGGVKGFFKGFGQGVTGLIAKPAVGVLDLASGALHSVAASTSDNVSEEAEIAPEMLFSVDGYIRLLWYKHAKNVPLPTSMPPVPLLLSPTNANANANASANNTNTVGGAGRGSRWSVSGSNSARPVSINRRVSALVGEEMKAEGLIDVASNRLLSQYREHLLVTIKLNFNRAVLICTNYRLAVLPLPAHFARALPENMAERKRPPVVATITVSSRNPLLHHVSASQTQSSRTEESDSLNVWLSSQHGTANLEVRSDEVDDALLVQCVLLDPENQAECRVSYRVATASREEAISAASLLNAFRESLDALYDN